MNSLKQLKFWPILLLFSIKAIIAWSHPIRQDGNAFISETDSLYQATGDSLQEEIILFHPTIIENKELENGSYSIIADSAICTSYPKEAVSLQLLLQQQADKITQKRMQWVQIVSYTGGILLALLFLNLIYKHIRHKKQTNLIHLQSKEIINQKHQNKIQMEELQLLHNEKKLYFEQFIMTQLFYKSLMDLLKEHKDNLHNHELIDAALWKSLITTLDKYANHFSNRLQQQYLHLKPEDIRFCCLIKIGLKYSDIACLLGRTPNMMYKRRDVVISRMKIDIPKAHFDDFIKDF